MAVASDPSTGNPNDKLAAIQSIGNTGRATPQTVGRLAQTLLEDVSQQTPLRQLDDNYLRQRAAHTLIVLAQNQDPVALQSLAYVTQTILKRPNDDVGLKAELIHGLTKLGLDRQKPFSPLIAQEMANEEIAAAVQARRSYLSQP